MPIPGCENYNADFFEKKGMSFKCETTEEILVAVKELLTQPEKAQKMIKQQENYIDQDACNKICDLILKECKKYC